MENYKARNEALSILEEIDTYTPKKVKDASNNVGLYAWYSAPNIGRPDWEENIEDGEDKGASLFRRLLDRHTNRHKTPSHRSTVTGPFGQKLEGNLEDRSYEEISGELDDQKKPVLETIGSPGWREKMVKLLPKCTPFLAAPIYIGVTDSLKERLRSHVSGLRRMQSGLRGESPPKDFDGDESEFAVRAAKMGFNVENLYVVTLTTADSDDRLDEDQVRSISEAVEWFLNRWHRPLLGKK